MTHGPRSPLRRTVGPRPLVALAAVVLLAAPASAQGFASAARRTLFEGDPQGELIVRVRADGRAAVLRPQAQGDGRRERFGLLLPSQVEALGHALREARLDDPPRSSAVDWPSELFDDRVQYSVRLPGGESLRIERHASERESRFAALDAAFDRVVRGVDDSFTPLAGALRTIRGTLKLTPSSFPETVWSRSEGSWSLVTEEGEVPLRGLIRTHHVSGFHSVLRPLEGHEVDLRGQRLAEGLEVDWGQLDAEHEGVLRSPGVLARDDGVVVELVGAERGLRRWLQSAVGRRVVVRGLTAADGSVLSIAGVRVRPTEDLTVRVSWWSVNSAVMGEVVFPPSPGPGERPARRGEPLWLGQHGYLVTDDWRIGFTDGSVRMGTPAAPFSTSRGLTDRLGGR